MTKSSVRFTAFRLCALALLLSASMLAQVSRVAGQLSGTVRDSADAYVSGAQVVATNADTDQQWTALTNTEGRFRFSNLPDGTYVVRVRKAEFAELVSRPIAIAVGTVAQIALQLQPASIAQQITVSAETSVLDTEKTSPSAVVDKERIEESPVQSRNYLNFILLAPGVAPARETSSPNSLSLPNSGFSFGGLRPRSNVINMDGANNNDEFTGANRTEISLEDVQEFHVVNHGFAAESGGAAGGSINVVTRAGSNTVHGDAFIFVQNGAFDAKPPLESAPGKPDLSRQRLGFSIGGPIRKSKSFYYTAFEQEHARGEDASDLSPAAVAALDVALLPTGKRATTGFFPTEREETEFSQRFDQQLGTKNALMVRYSFNNSREVNDAFNTSELVDFSSRGSSFNLDHQLVAGITTTVSPQAVNDLRVQFSARRATQRTTDTTGPGLEVPGMLQFGRTYSGNGTRHEDHRELNEAYAFQRGSHLFKAGLWVDYIRERAALADGFGSVFVFPTLNALALGTPDFYQQAFGNPNTNFGETRYAGFVQDHWMVRPNLTLDYGLRWDFNHLPPGFSQHANNFSPRVGFAYRPFGNWLVRGGFGMFYDRYPLAAINQTLQKSGIRAFDQVVDGAEATAIYRQGVLTSAITGIKPSIAGVQPDLPNPYAEVATVAIERSLAKDLSIGASYSFVHGVNLLRTANVNLPPPTLLTSTNAAQLGIPAPSPQQLGRFVFPPFRLNPASDRIDQLQSTAGSSYQGLTLTVNRRFSREFALLASYTYSKTIDDASEFAEQPQNPYAPGAERSVSLQEQPQRFVMSALWELPIGDEEEVALVKTNPSLLTRVFLNIEVAPIFSARSGLPADPLVGSDANLSHVYPFVSRPLGFGRNSLRTPSGMTLDLRILKWVKIGRGKLDFVAESFNLFNHLNILQLNESYGANAAPNPSFGQPIQAETARQVQFSLDYEF